MNQETTETQDKKIRQCDTSDMKCVADNCFEKNNGEISLKLLEKKGFIYADNTKIEKIEVFPGKTTRFALSKEPFVPGKSIVRQGISLMMGESKPLGEETKNGYLYKTEAKPMM